MMDVDKTTYNLPTDNFVPIESIKRQIVIGHTFNHDMKHYAGWVHRYNGKFKRTAAFTVTTDGKIYQHFDPSFQSRYFNNQELDKKSIVILLENDGWLTNHMEKNVFITWIGDIYKQPNEVVYKKWRGYSHWCPYTNEQVNSVMDLIKKLCSDFYIPLFLIEHNTKIDDSANYGIIYKSNLDKHYTDLSPAWNCMMFKDKLELN